MGEEELVNQESEENSKTDEEVEKEEDIKENLELITNEEQAEAEDEADEEELLDDEVEIEVSEEEFLQLKEKANQLAEENEKYKDRIQRLQAEFSNYKKRVAKEKKRLRCTATEELLIELLPIIDNFERALSSVKEEQELDEVIEGLNMIWKQLLKVLEEEGVTEIDTVGEEFDPNLHEAMMKVESAEYESGIIVEELQKGYLFEDQVLRPAMVKVAE
ncbi:nucleotide exchange factor GrpE [Fuchsiella alkaliacetigena]|uniref:nucleotide exchange factor GrpE n=1 Tax=Fuchsiella alkaliacetigena TaxID=957042 RepID=UPI00200A8933|nr:nucleotide exchange factor GrpE [Fuchsiella alkaliacetigena]MCK8825147.1 nucleotide exchange factor GrpE [Fuchsiella alkaliacetigena]